MFHPHRTPVAFRFQDNLKGLRAIACAVAAMALATAPWSRAADTTLHPVADTYAQSNKATSNFGSVATIESNNYNGVRVMLLRFDLSAIAAPITNLRLTLTALQGTAGNVFQVFGLTSGENWSESTVSWSTAPGVNQGFTASSGAQADYLTTSSFANGGASLATYSSQVTGAVVAFDVSGGPVIDFVNADADKVVTFLIAEADPADSGGDRYGSREATSGQPTLVVSTGGAAANSGVLRVVLVGGQSNADGRAAGSGLPTALQTPQADVPFYYYTYGTAANSDGTLGLLTTLRPGGTQMPSGGFGPEVALGYFLAPSIERQTGARLAVLKFAQGGTDLMTAWKADGTTGASADGASYQTFQKVVAAGLARLRTANPGATVSVAGMIWAQGESDIDDGSAAVSAYAANLTRFIADVRATVCTTMPFFLSRISSHQTMYSSPSASGYQNYLALRGQQAQVAANVANTYLIDTDGSAFTTNSDNLHFDAGGQQALGSAFAQAMAPLLLLRVTPSTRNGNLMLQWNGISGKRYQVGTSSDLLSWTTQSVGAVSTYSDPITTAQRFYRVLELDDTVSAGGN